MLAEREKESALVLGGGRECGLAEMGQKRLETPYQQLDDGIIYC